MEDKKFVHEKGSTEDNIFLFFYFLHLSEYQNW